MDDLAGKPVGFLYSKRRNQLATVNLDCPTAEDIAAGLSRHDRSDLMARVWNAKLAEPEFYEWKGSLRQWRAALISRIGPGRPVTLTSVGAEVFKTLRKQAGQ